MTGVEAYRLYMAVKLHFTQDNFDVFNTRRVKMAQATFESRRDQQLFDLLAVRYPTPKDFVRFIVANFAYDNPDVIYGDIQLAEANLEQWIARRQSITHVLFNDAAVLQGFLDQGHTPDQLIHFTSSDYPAIIPFVAGNHVTIETASILNDRLNFIESWSAFKIPMLMVESLVRRMRKLSGFVQYDKSRVNPIIDSIFKA